MKKPKVTATYEYTNPHPNEIKSLGDCVFRAISIATGKSWLEIYDELCTLGRENLAPPNDGETYKPYLDKIGSRVEVIVNRKRLTGADLAKRKDGNIYVIRTANHLSTIKDSKVRDTWDSGQKSGYIIWQIN